MPDRICTFCVKISKRQSFLKNGLKLQFLNLRWTTWKTIKVSTLLRRRRLENWVVSRICKLAHPIPFLKIWIWTRGASATSTFETVNNWYNSPLYNLQIPQWPGYFNEDFLKKKLLALPGLNPCLFATGCPFFQGFASANSVLLPLTKFFI